jgi:L-threonylcarbamoyladenylate synthase
MDTVAIRQPDHPVALELIAKAGRPIAAPSANRSGSISPTTAQHVEQSLGSEVDLIIDGGACRVGVESTILDLTGDIPTILRPGGLSVEQLEQVLGRPVAKAASDAAITAPGMMTSHYAPACPMRLNQTKAQPGEALLGFGPDTPDAALNLSPTGDLIEAAANLFAMMRQLDTPDFSAIVVAPIPEHGLGLAINDRLRRAAAPK